jgi:DNA primase
VCIGKELVEAVRELSQIEHIVAEYVELRRSGVQLIGRCPFHTDRTPSFVVNRGKQVFYCHGCQVGGDVFELVRRLHRCSFRQSLEFLAIRAGLQIDRFKASAELTAKVSALNAERAKQAHLARFTDNWLRATNQRYRSLCRAATNAENCLRTGKVDAYEQDLAWNALARYRTFEERVEMNCYRTVLFLGSESKREYA